MITGRTYEETREWWRVICRGAVDELNAVGNGAGLRKHQIADLLATMGKDVPIVEAPAIVSVQREHGIRHCVVVTAEGKILDPAVETPAAPVIRIRCVDCGELVTASNSFAIIYNDGSPRGQVHAPLCERDFNRRANGRIWPPD